MYFAYLLHSSQYVTFINNNVDPQTDNNSPFHFLTSKYEVFSPKSLMDFCDYNFEATLIFSVLLS